jgi:hypothetical protein
LRYLNQSGKEGNHDGSTAEDKRPRIPPSFCDIGLRRGGLVLVVKKIDRYLNGIARSQPTR